MNDTAADFARFADKMWNTLFSRELVREIYQTAYNGKTIAA